MLLRKIIFVFFVPAIILFSCSENKDNIKQDKIVLKKQIVYMTVPGNYVRQSFSKIKEGLSDLSKDTFINLLIKQLNSYSSDIKVYVDTLETDFFSYIILKEGEKLRLNVNNSDILKKAIRKGIYQKAEFYGKISLLDLTEEKITAGNYPYMKIKYKVKVPDFVFYQTDYFINTETSTLLISISNRKGNDFEKNIKFMTIKDK